MRVHCSSWASFPFTMAEDASLRAGPLRNESRRMVELRHRLWNERGRKGAPAPLLPWRRSVRESGPGAGAGDSSRSSEKEKVTITGALDSPGNKGPEATVQVFIWLSSCHCGL